MKCVGVNDKECNAWVYDPNFPNDNVCASCARELDEGNPTATEQLHNELINATSQLIKAQETEERTGEAIDSMNRAYWEGYAHALGFAVEKLIKEGKK